MGDRVLIYVRASKEWYCEEGRGVTRNRDEAHRYTRRHAENLVGTDAQVEIQNAESEERKNG